MSMTSPRYFVSSSAGSKPGKPWAVVDRRDMQQGKGMKRVAFYSTMKAAQERARRMNREHARDLMDAWPAENGRNVAL